MTSAVETNLETLGLSVPAARPPVGSYVAAVRQNGFVHTSGQLPMGPGGILATGKVGTGDGLVPPELAAECARVAALNCLGALKALIGDLDLVTQVVKATIFVASDPSFSGQPTVANGASDLFVAAFGEAGRHARSAVGVASLPLNSPVEVEIIVAVRDTSGAPDEH